VRVIGSSDAFTYTPASGYLGADSFSFTVTDTGNPPGNMANAKTSAPATVSVTVVDPAPVGVADSYTTRAGVALNVPVAQGVLVNDTDAAGDALTATLATSVAHGTLVLNSNGSFSYTPAATFTGSDSFTYLPHGTYVTGGATSVTISVTGGIAPPPPPGKKGGAAPPAPPLPAGSSGDVGGGGGVTEAALVAAPQTPVTTTASQPTTDDDFVVKAASADVTSDSSPLPPSTAATPATDPTVLLSMPVEPTTWSDVPSRPVTASSAGANVSAAVTPVAHPIRPAARGAWVVPEAIASPPTFLPFAPDLHVMALAEQGTPAIVLVASAADQPQTQVATDDVADSDDSALAPMSVAAVTTQATVVAASTPAFWMDDTAVLMAVSDPIVLPSFTLPGDETSALMLPAAPEISHLPRDFAAAVRRLTERAPAIVAFVDPVTGQLVNPAFPQTMQPVKEQAWLLVDTDPDDNLGALSSRIRWDSHPI
jgi:VCBS repeat-containing protein